MMKAKWVALPLIVTVLFISGCSHKATPSTSPSATPPAISTTSIDGNAVYNQATGWLESFLEAWKRSNAYDAGLKYLDSSIWPTRKDGNPILISGKVKRVKPYAWVSADHFTMMVDLELRFSGNAGAWGNGINTRFVTFVRSSRTAPFRMSFATGP